MSRFHSVAVVALLCAHALLAATSAERKSAAYDEIAHVSGGLLAVESADLRWNPENGWLPQVWAALPMSLSDPPLENADPELWSRLDSWRMGRHLLYADAPPGDPNHRLRHGRWMIVAASTLLVLGIYLWSRQLYGSAAGLLSLALAACSPTLIASGRLVTSDTFAGIGFLAALWAIARSVEVLTPGRVAAAALALAVAFLSKHSAAILVPLYLLLAAWRSLDGRPLQLDIAAKTTTLGGRGEKALAFLAIGCLWALSTAAALWATHGFGADFGALPIAWEPLLAAAGAGGTVIAVLRESGLVPETYLYGLAFVLAESVGRPSFLCGESFCGGTLSYFPTALALKTPLSTFAVLVLAGFASVRGTWAASAMAIFAFLYAAMSLTADLNIGHRHLLPLYAVGFVFAGRAARHSQPLLRHSATALAMLLAVDTASAWPDYLAYGNPLAGGRDGLHRVFADSSVDFGQDLPALAKWVDEADRDDAPNPPLYLAYFGTASPEAHGVRARPLPSDPDFRSSRSFSWLEAGVYALSAGRLSAHRSPAMGPWSEEYEDRYRELRAAIAGFLALAPDARQSFLETRASSWIAEVELFEELRLARLAVALRAREPDASLGGSILVYVVGREELDRALFGRLPTAAGTCDGSWGGRNCCWEARPSLMTTIR